MRIAKTSRQQQAEKTKELIFDSAIALFRKESFNTITVADICKAAGVSVGTFYHYFPSKQAVMQKIFKDIDDYFRKVVSQEINELEGKGTRAEILHYFRRYSQYSERQGLDFVKQLYTFDNNLFRIKGRFLQVYLGEIITRGQQTGELDNSMTPEEMVEYLYIAARGIIYHWAVHEGEYELTNYLMHYMDRLLTSLEKTNSPKIERTLMR